jgi:hypothetical protein
MIDLSIYLPTYLQELITQNPDGSHSVFYHLVSEVTLSHSLPGTMWVRTSGRDHWGPS